MELSQYLAILRRWWWLLLASTVIAGGLAYAASQRITPTYQATATLLVVQRQAEGVIQLNDLVTSERLAATFSRLATIRPVLDQAIEQGDLGLTPVELERRLTVSNPRSTQLLEVRAEASAAGRASHIANTVAEAFIASNETALSTRPGTVSIVERAVPPTSPIAPNSVLNALMGATLGVLAATALMLLFEYLDDTVKSPQHISELTGLPTLARLEDFGRARLPSEQIRAAHSSRSAVAEEYRAMRTNLSYAMGDDRKLLMITSPSSGEGKSTTVANLAVVFGLAERRVCVLDTDLRRPRLHEIFGLDNSEGLTNLLLAPQPALDRAIQRTTYTNVSVITSGQVPLNPSELLGSARMQFVLEAVRDRFDIVIMDSPPALVVTDAQVMATLADEILVVVNANKTRTGPLKAAVEELAHSGRPIAGVVLNRVHAGDSYYFRYDRAYYETEPLAALPRSGDDPPLPFSGSVSGNGTGAAVVDRDEVEASEEG